MPRTNKLGRPKLSDDEKKHNCSVRLTDADRILLEKNFGTVQKALDHKIVQVKKVLDKPK